MTPECSLCTNIQAEMHHEFSDEADIVLFRGDAFDLLATIPDRTIKLIVTSPPYNIGKEYETRIAIEDYLSQQTQIIRELYRVLRDDGSICWQVGNYVEDGEIYPLDIFFYSIFKELGMRLRNRVVWHFRHGLHASNRFSGRYETLLWFSKTDDYTFNLDAVRVPSKYPGKRHYRGNKKGKVSGNILGKNPADVWEFLAEEWERALWDIPNCKANHPEKTVHPAQFPVELVERCVLAFTNPGDWVLDPFVGVGSTILGAVRQARKAVGSEKESQYLEIARERVQDYFKGTLRIRPLGKPVYRPNGREKVAQIPPEWLHSSSENGLRVVGVYSFNKGLERMRQDYPDELKEIYSVLQSVDVRMVTRGESENTSARPLRYGAHPIKSMIKMAFATRAWEALRVPCHYPTKYYLGDYAPPTELGLGAFREIDFVKNQVGVEVHFGKYSPVIDNVITKMPIFHKLGHIAIGVQIVPIKEMAIEVAGGGAYFGQFLWDLDQRGVSDIDVPVLILGVAPASWLGEVTPGTRSGNTPSQT